MRDFYFPGLSIKSSPRKLGRCRTMRVEWMDFVSQKKMPFPRFEKAFIAFCNSQGALCRATTAG